MNDNYIILRDEDGKAYIAHANVPSTDASGSGKYANWGKGAQRAGHKYIARLLENGKYWYAYTQQQLQAHLQGAKNKAQNAVEEATGVAARKRMDAAAEKYPELERNRRAQNQAYDNAKANTDRAAKNMTDSYRSRVEAENRAKNSNVFNRKQRNADVATAKAQEEQYYQSHKNAQKAELEQKRKKEQTDRAYAEGNTDYQYNKHVYDNSLAGLVDRTAAGIRQAASNAKNAANNAVTKAKTQYDRMRDEFRDKAREAIGISDRERMDKAAERRDIWNNITDERRAESENAKKNFEKALDDRSKAQHNEQNAKALYDNSSIFDITRNKKLKEAQETTKTADKKYQHALNDASRAQNAYSDAQQNAAKAEEDYQKEKASYDKSIVGIYDRTVPKAREAVANARDSINEMLDTARNAARNASDKAKGAAESALNNNVKPAAQAMKNAIDSARTVAKDASENAAAKAKSEVDQATKAVQSMIDNARSATSKAVKDAWDNIPKNADGTVNPFDKDFSDAYNKWKTATAKYENSLTAKAKEQAKKAADAFDDAVKEARQKIQNGTATIQDYVNSGRETLNRLTENREGRKQESQQNLRQLEGRAAAKRAFREYSDNDSDFNEKNYSKENHVEDTDFYAFKRNDGRSVILEEDMKWVLPKSIDANDPIIRRALKQIANSGKFKTYDDWLENTNDILGDAIAEVREKQLKR